eukprot:scaffold311842_cov18-Tisochrysis_lutea.AAC.1
MHTATEGHCPGPEAATFSPGAIVWTAGLQHYWWAMHCIHKSRHGMRAAAAFVPAHVYTEALGQSNSMPSTQSCS